MPRLAVLFVLSAASSPCPDLNLIHYILLLSKPTLQPKYASTAASAAALKADASAGTAKALRKLPCAIWTHMSAFKVGIRLADKMHSAGNGPNHLFPPTTQQTNSNHGDHGNRQILQTRRTNPYSRLFHRKFSDGLIMK